MFTNKQFLNYLSPLLLLTVFASGLFADDDHLVLHEGTPLRLRLMQSVSSASAQEGDRVSFETLDAVQVDGRVVIPAQSNVQATVIEAVSKRRMARGGRLRVNVDYVWTPNGEKIPLRGIRNAKGGGHVGAMATGMVATAIVFWPATPVLLLMEGKDITIPEGQEVMVFTDSNYEFKPPASVVAKVSRPVAMHDADVLSLKTAGFSDEVVLAKIKSSPAMFELGSNDMGLLRARGVSETVIMAMLAAPGR